jgi:hypothetical protein
MPIAELPGAMIRSAVIALTHDSSAPTRRKGRSPMRILRYAAIVAAAAVAPAAVAGTFSFHGTFTNDTDVQFFSFTLAQDTANVALRTFSYGGGVNGAGQTILSGGFDTHLSLFQSDGTGMNPGGIGPCAGTPLTADPVTGICGDVYYPTTLSFPGGIWSAGTYTVALSLDANPAVGNLSDGFFTNAVLMLPSPSNFTCQEGPLGFQGNPPSLPLGSPFCDSVSSPTRLRTGNWALDIINVDSATEQHSTPEPFTTAQLAIGLTALGALWRRRRAG